MLAVSVVFGPRDGRNHVTNDVYRLVEEPSKLSVWNYGRYALEEIMRGALCLAESKRKGEQNVWLYGCPTILQV